jgi:hypothetical protein
MLKDFPQHGVDLYRNILGNPIRPNELKMIGRLSVNEESSEYIVDMRGPFRSWLKSADRREATLLSRRILSGHDV